MSTGIQIADVAPAPAMKLSPGPSLLKLCAAALYVGATGYGGPAILAQMKRKFVTKKHGSAKKTSWMR